MLKPSSSDNKNKFYINNHSLSVRGEKINIFKQKKTHCFQKRGNIKLEADSEEEIVVSGPNDGAVVKKKTKPRHVLQLNVTNYEDFPISNKQLREIQETVEVKDFQRILNAFSESETFYRHNYVRTSREEKILSKTYLTNVYEKYFGSYLNYMKNVVAK